jgi:hypothetical protein
MTLNRYAALPRDLMGWNQLCRSLDQLLINLLAGRVSSLFKLVWLRVYVATNPFFLKQ